MFQLLKDLYLRSKKHEIIGLSAQVTFYLLFSFFPFLMLIITLTTYTPLLNQGFLNNLSWFLPEQTYEFVISITNELLQQRNATLVSFSMIATIWIASRSVRALTKAVNTAYNIEETRPYGLILINSLVFTLLFAFSITIAFLALVLGQTLGELAFKYIGLSDLFAQVWDISRFLFALVVMILLLTVLYLYLPNYKLRLRNVLPGALFTTVGWLVISVGFSYYVNHFAAFSYIYGSIGTFIILIMWLHLSSIIFLIGGEINAVIGKNKYLNN